MSIMLNQAEHTLSKPRSENHLVLVWFSFSCWSAMPVQNSKVEVPQERCRVKVFDFGEVWKKWM